MGHPWNVATQRCEACGISVEEVSSDDDGRDLCFAEHVARWSWAQGLRAHGWVEHLRNRTWPGRYDVAKPEARDMLELRTVQATTTTVAVIELHIGPKARVLAFESGLHLYPLWNHTMLAQMVMQLSDEKLAAILALEALNPEGWALQPHELWQRIADMLHFPARAERES